jgi:signal peptidase II
MNVDTSIPKETMQSDQTERTDQAKRMPTFGGHLLFWSIALAGATADLWSKNAVHKWLASLPGNEISIVDGLVKFVIRHNNGAAFSIAQGKTTILITVSVVALVMIIGIFLFGRIHSRLMQVALALFTAGIIGNLYDRAFNEGFVRDFIDAYWRGHHWPAFNIADSMLCVSVGLIILCNLTSASCQKPAHRQK